MHTCVWGKGVALSVAFIMNLTITLQEEKGECVYSSDETAFPQGDPGCRNHNNITQQLHAGTV